MEDKKESKTSLPLPAMLLIAALVAGGIFKFYSPMDSMRPQSGEKKARYQLGDEKVLARMWQDPFQAVEKHLRNLNDDKKYEEIAFGFQSRLDPKDERILILPVLTTAGNYAENVEKRLRSRYALLSALHVAGYRPDNASHIGAFRRYIIGKDRQIPYEWFTFDKLNINSDKSSQNNKGTYDKVLILWLGDEYFSGNRLEELRNLSKDMKNCIINKHNLKSLHVDNKFIGPSNSVNLENIFLEAYNEPIKKDKSKYILKQKRSELSQKDEEFKKIKESLKILNTKNKKFKEIEREYDNVENTLKEAKKRKENAQKKFNKLKLSFENDDKNKTHFKKKFIKTINILREQTKYKLEKMRAESKRDKKEEAVNKLSRELEKLNDEREEITKAKGQRLEEEKKNMLEKKFLGTLQKDLQKRLEDIDQSIKEMQEKRLKLLNEGDFILVDQLNIKIDDYYKVKAQVVKEIRDNEKKSDEIEKNYQKALSDEKDYYRDLDAIKEIRDQYYSILKQLNEKKSKLKVAEEALKDAEQNLTNFEGNIKKQRKLKKYTNNEAVFDLAKNQSKLIKAKEELENAMKEFQKAEEDKTLLKVEYEKAKSDANNIDNVKLTKKLDHLEKEHKNIQTDIRELEQQIEKKFALEIYSPWSTADTFLLDLHTRKQEQQAQLRISDIIENWEKKITEFEGKDYFTVTNLNQVNISLKRSIHTDQLITDELVNELIRRGVKLGVDGTDHIVLISEWDTFYGRALPLSFAISIEKYREKHKKNESIVDTAWPERIHKIAYMRGIDGMLPGEDNDSDSSVSKTTKATQRNENNSNMGYYAPEFKQPLGQAQFDYMRRLVNRIKQLQLAGSTNGEKLGGKIRAIGILGSDIYDKLLILRALRTKFPNAIFFTNDLDARLFHHAELPWTHNLIVVSSYGLQLHPYLQKDIPPFRSVYQSSLFVATLQALGIKGNIDFKKTRPRIFEIGRQGPFDLTPIPVVSSEFFRDEFIPSIFVAKLCKKINKDVNNLHLDASENTINWLNELLSIPKLFDILPRKKLNIKIKIQAYETEGYRNKSYSNLGLDEQKNIKRLNRLLLEEIYSEYTPKIHERKTYAYLKGASSEFSLDEFGRFPVRELCKKINNVNNLHLDAPKNTINWLNELLRYPGLYDNLLEKNPDFKKKIMNVSFFTKLNMEMLDIKRHNDIMTLVKETKGYRNKSYYVLGLDEQINIERLNRFLLEKLYPKYTPEIYERKTTSLYLSESVSDFTPNEFTQTLSVKKLCDKIVVDAYLEYTPIIHMRKKDFLYSSVIPTVFSLDANLSPLSIIERCEKFGREVYKIKSATKNTTDWLNELLRFSRLYKILGTKKSDYSNSLQTLVDETDGHRNKGYSELGYNKQMNIKRLNRLLLEETYPEYTPKFHARKTNVLHPERYDLWGNNHNKKIAFYAFFMFCLPLLLFGWLIYRRLNDVKSTESYRKWKEAEEGFQLAKVKISD